ncbi:MAG: HzsA-related protein, partial [Planctomycetota bacterium]
MRAKPDTVRRAGRVSAPDSTSGALMRRAVSRWLCSAAALLAVGCVTPVQLSDIEVEAVREVPREPVERPLRAQLDAPLLFVKRQPYFAPHIYDDYYPWRPGGGIYILENPADPPEKHRVRPVIDPSTKPTLGEGVYRDPELSWDARKIVFAYKGEQGGCTSIHEINLDGTGLRQLTYPELDCDCNPVPRRYGSGHHDVTPCYLPDGRIVFTSTRRGHLVPCFNSSVDILHVMDPDGSNIRPLSVNNTNEFDPAVMLDGRILYGRWEYVDKTALYMQSLWTVFPDGTNETALFANNLAKPTALLDARPVPDSHMVVASLTPHNGQAVGAIAMIDARKGKNELKAITNFTPKYRTQMDQGLKRGPSDPWPLDENAVLIADNAKGHGVIRIISRDGRSELVHSDPKISCYSPMLVKPRPRPPVVPAVAEDGPDLNGTESGRFLVTDVYRGLDGVKRGEITHLRVVEETARVSGLPPGGRWWNQAFLVSWQGAYTIKNILGTVPVRKDGSAYFQAPPGKALYFQALDKEGRCLQSMRTFVQAVPGATRSCVGCHERKRTAPPPRRARPLAAAGAPDSPREESWGSGYLDYPTQVQPILDKHCVKCHGGKKDIAGGLDFSGGWTWAFNISYETLIKNTLTGFLNCNNGSVHTSKILPPRKHGSGAAPLSAELISGHWKRIKGLTRTERDTILAWMDTNCNYHGTWNWTEHATCNEILSAGKRLTEVMRRADCTRCHAPTVGNDWINLRRPEMSRILRAPLPDGVEGTPGFGLGTCRDRKARAVLPLVTQRQQPPDVHRPRRTKRPDPNDDLVTPFETTANEHYREMLSIIRQARTRALKTPRIDMPGARINPGECRQLVPPPLPEKLPPLQAAATPDGVVRLSWRGSSPLIGLTFEVYRDETPGFACTDGTRIGTTTFFRYDDQDRPPGQHHYAMTAVSNGERLGPVRVSATVPKPQPPAAPAGLVAVAGPEVVELTWAPSEQTGVRYYVYRKGR